MYNRKIDILLDSLENGHMIIDEEFIVKYWNRWLCINTQISDTEIIGKSLKEFYPDLNYDVLKRKIKTALKLGSPSFYDPNSNTKFIPLNRNKVTTSSLVLMQQQVTVTPYIVDENQVIISMYDISELHETKLLLQKEVDKVNNFNNELENRVNEALYRNNLQQKKAIAQARLVQMGEMISMIAHQWRQPLGAISATVIDMKMQSELGCFDLTQKEEVQRYEEYVNNGLDSIGDFVKNLTTIIDDFRNFYKSNNKKVTSTLEEIINKSLTIIKASLYNNNIDIIEKYNSSQKVEVYENELMQVVLNILKNSQDNFLEKQIKDPYIEITIENKSISICDNGGGIRRDIIEKIYNPYFTTKGDINGTGLGLYMSKIIVEEHHKGKLSVHNTDDGVCFIIEI